MEATVKPSCCINGLAECFLLLTSWNGWATHPPTNKHSQKVVESKCGEGYLYESSLGEGGFVWVLHEWSEGSAGFSLPCSYFSFIFIGLKEEGGRIKYQQKEKFIKLSVLSKRFIVNGNTCACSIIRHASHHGVCCKIQEVLYLQISLTSVFCKFKIFFVIFIHAIELNACSTSPFCLSLWFKGTACFLKKCYFPKHLMYSNFT